MEGRVLNAFKARHVKKISQIEGEIDKEQRSKAYYKRRCQILERIVCDIDYALLPPKSASSQETFFDQYKQGLVRGNKMAATEHVESFQESFVHEILNNGQRPPTGRRWSLPLLMLAFVLHSLGSKCYHYLRSFVALPAKQTLYNHFGKPVEGWMESLLDVSRVRSICHLFRRRHGLSLTEEIEVVIGIDAMAIEPVAMDQYHATVGDSHVFLFELLPLSCELKAISIHIMPQQNGNAGEAVRQRLEVLTKILQDLHFIVRSTASDGDRGYEAMHRDMASQWVPQFLSTGLEAALECVRGYDNCIIGDFLHMLKNARARVFNGKVSVFATGNFPFDANDMNKVLKLGRSLTDNTSKGRMRDSYALEIFTLDNFRCLVDQECEHIAFYILPYALWNTVVNNPSLSCQMRREMLSMALDIFAMWMINMKDVDKTLVSINKNKDGVIQFACSESHVRRAMNTLVFLLIELERHPENLALDRIGTHPVECRFGTVRLLCRNKHSWSRVVNSFSKLTLVNDLASILGHPLVIRDRVNSGGVKVTSSAGIHIPRPAESIIQVYESMKVVLFSRSGMLFESLKDEAKSVVDSFMQYIVSLIEECHVCNTKPVKLYHGTSVSNASITARLVSFCQNPLVVDDDDVGACDAFSVMEEAGDDNDFVHPRVVDPEFADVEVPKSDY